MSETFDFFTGGSIENKLAVVLSWHEELDGGPEDLQELAGLILQIPDVIDNSDDVDWFSFYDALGSYPNLADDADLLAIYQRADRHLNSEG